MNKLLICGSVVTMLVLLLTVAVFAATPSKEILADPDFEEANDEAWVRYVQAVIEFTDEAPREGSSCLLVTERTHATDVVRQYVTDQMNYYGPGKYKISGYARLADPDQSPIEMQLVLGCYTEDEKKWETSSFCKVTADHWTEFSFTAACRWEDELASAELYFITDETDTEQGEFADILIDTCSMVKADFEGTDFWDLTPAPTNEPTTASTAKPTAAPAVTEAPTPLAAEEPKKTAVSTKKILGIALIAAGAILLGTGTALIISARKGKKDEKKADPCLRQSADGSCHACLRHPSGGQR